MVVFTKTYGRKVLYANITEQDLLSMEIEAQNETVLRILEEVMPLHNANKLQCEYLKAYKDGMQDIYTEKVKLTRPEINNKTVENWAYALIDFKKCFLLGKPIQYTQVDDASTDEISKLNKYCKYENKKAKDMDIYDDILTCGRGFRYTNTDKPKSEDEAPFELINLDVENTEVVYSSGIRKEQLFSFIETPMQYVKEEKDLKTGELKPMTMFYSNFTIYLRNRSFTVTNKDDGYAIVKDSENPLILGKHIIQEYYINKSRISLIELGKDLLNDINYLESLDKDDMEQFVNAIMVFTNAEVNKEGMDAIKEYGAVSIKSTEQKKASVEILQSRLKSLDTQIFYLRKMGSLFDILGVPKPSSDSNSNAETGKASLTGQGFTSSNIRVEGEELAFKKGDKSSLKTILKICKRSPKSKIKNLKVSDIDIKLSRDLSENILVKSQALMNLATANIPPEIRNQVINLFSDPAMVTKLQKAYEEEKRKIQEEMTKKSNNNENKVNEQNNKISKTVENEKQGN